MEFYWFILAVLAVWRVAHLLTAEDGPFDLFARIRETVGIGFWGKLLDCFDCVSLWVAVPIALQLGKSMQEKLLLWLACSGGAIILERLTASRAAPAPVYWEEEEENHELLRKPAHTKPTAAIARIYEDRSNAAASFGKTDSRF